MALAGNVPVIQPQPAILVMVVKHTVQGTLFAVGLEHVARLVVCALLPTLAGAAPSARALPATTEPVSQRPQLLRVGFLGFVSAQLVGQGHSVISTSVQTPAPILVFAMERLEYVHAMYRTTVLTVRSSCQHSTLWASSSVLK